MVDKDGSFDYSNIVIIKVNEKVHLNVWPNPFKDQIQVSIQMDKNDLIPVRLVDVSGKTIRFTNVSVQRGRNQFTIDGLGNLQPGVYFIELSDNNKRAFGPVKVLKQ